MAKKQSEFVSHLRELLGKIETQAKLAKLVGASDSRVPEWMKGKRLPSPDTLIKLGGLALDHRLSDPFFFWALAGVDTLRLRKMADTVQERQYEFAGPTVPISRFRVTMQGREPAGTPVALPKEFIPNPGSTICLLVDRESTGVSDVPRGLFVLDTSVEGTEDLSGLWDRVVMLQYSPDFPSSHRPVGVYAGRLRLQDDIFHPSEPDVVRMVGWLDSLGQASHGSVHIGAYCEPEGRRGIAAGDRDAWLQRHDEILSRAVSNFRIMKGVKILGEIIGRLTGHLKKSRQGEEEK